MKKKGKTKKINQIEKIKKETSNSDLPDLARDCVEFGLSNEEAAFVFYYVKNDSTYGNGTMSYAMAYGFDLDSYPKDDAKYKNIYANVKGKKVFVEKKMIQESSYTRAEATCAVNASKLLRRTKIQDLRVKYLNDLMTDEIVDAELTKVIKQNHSPQAKVAAIRERNKIAGRHVERFELTGADGEKLFGDEHKQKSKKAIGRLFRRDKSNS